MVEYLIIFSVLGFIIKQCKKQADDNRYKNTKEEMVNRYSQLERKQMLDYKITHPDFKLNYKKNEWSR